MGLIPQLTDAGKAMMIKALTGQKLNFTKVKLGDASASVSIHDGEYWYDTENQKLYRYTESWQPSTIGCTISSTAPTDAASGSFWYNPETDRLYKCSLGWVQQSAKISCSSVSPSNPSIGDYWYDTANEIFYRYRMVWNTNSSVSITAGSTEPANPSIGSYWYSTVKSSLNVCVGTWASKSGINITVSATEPENPEDGDYWYNSTTNTMKVCTVIPASTTAPSDAEDGTEETDDATDSVEWNDTEQVIVVGESTPDNPVVGGWWYNTSTNALTEYTAVFTDDTTHNFTYGTTAPTSPQNGDWWFDESLHVYGASWASESEQDFTYGAAAANNPSRGDWWYSTTNHVLYAYGVQWAADTTSKFSYSVNQPLLGEAGDYWYDSELNALKIYMSGWYINDQKFYYSKRTPSTPNAGDWWYSTTEAVLYEYSGTKWVTSNITLTCSISKPNTADALKDLINPIMSAPITEILKGSNYVSLTTALSNSDLTSGFRWAETGVFAQIDGGAEELYAYCDAGDDYDSIPSNTSGRTINETFTLLVMVGDAEYVSATIGEGSLYATKQALSEHLRDNNNPHGVTAEQIGLGNVQNVPPEEMTVSYTASDKLSGLSSGESLQTALGKIRKAISTLIAHLKSDNPHNITVAKISAAPKTHNHDVSDITGVLPVQKGGTGVQSMQALANTLGGMISTGSCVFGVYTGNGTVKRTIPLEFTPSAVLITNGRGMTGDDIDGVCGGLAVGTRGLRSRNCTAISHETTWSNEHTALLICNNGFYVNYNSSNRISTNKSGETYRYIAFK